MRLDVGELRSEDDDWPGFQCFLLALHMHLPLECTTQPASTNLYTVSCDCLWIVFYDSNLASHASPSSKDEIFRWIGIGHVTSICHVYVASQNGIPSIHGVKHITSPFNVYLMMDVIHFTDRPYIYPRSSPS